MKTYKDALKYLEQLCQFGIKEGLERTKKLAAALGNPQNFYRTIHVTGTNGKGSVCAMLAEMLKAQGLKSECLDRFRSLDRVKSGLWFK